MKCGRQDKYYVLSKMTMKYYVSEMKYLVKYVYDLSNY